MSLLHEKGSECCSPLSLPLEFVHSDSHLVNGKHNTVSLGKPVITCCIPGNTWLRAEAKADCLSFPTKLKTTRPTVQIRSHYLPSHPRFPPYLGMWGRPQHRERRHCPLSHIQLLVALETLGKCALFVNTRTVLGCEKQSELVMLCPVILVPLPGGGETKG